MIIVVICLAIIAYIAFKKLDKVSVLNYEASKTIQQVEIKRKLLEDRLQRKFSGLGLNLKKFFKPLGALTANKFKIWYQKIVELEEDYRHKILHDSFKDKIAVQQYTNQLSVQALTLIEQGDFQGAEKKYIEILELDERNQAAYLGLGNLYLKQKNYEQAKETLEFLLKLNQGDASVYRSLGEISSGKGDLKMASELYLKSLELDGADVNTHLDLAEVYLNLDEPAKAFTMVDRASAIEPNNPKVLDFLIEVSIIVRDREAASKAYRLLKEVNPENQKLADFKERIAKL
jgi:tetratricopeptide (TPR) repeat protein